MSSNNDVSGVTTTVRQPTTIETNNNQTSSVKPVVRSKRGGENSSSGGVGPSGSGSGHHHHSHNRDSHGGKGEDNGDGDGGDGQDARNGGEAGSAGTKSTSHSMHGNSGSGNSNVHSQSQENHPSLHSHHHHQHQHQHHSDLSLEASSEPGHGHDIDESVSVSGSDSKGRSKNNRLPACMQNAFHLTWIVPSYTKLREEATHKKCHTTETQVDENGHSWRLKLYPNGTKSDGNLSLFLDIPELPFGWERTVCFALTLVSLNDPNKSVTKNVHRHVFKSQKNDLCNWGWSAFVNAIKVARESYLQNDEMHVTAAITVESTSTKMDPSEVDVYLSYASESGCAESVMTCLAQGACVNSESEDKFTPLHYACNTTKEYLPVVELLVEKGADVNKLNKYGETALLKASYRGHAGVVQTLLDSGANTEPTSTAGLSALSAAVGQGHLAVAKALVELKAPLDTPATSPPLWEAIANKRWGCAKLLIQAGCSVHAPHEAPNPSFLCAAAERGAPIVKMLIDFGARIEEKDDRALTPLLCAAKAGKTETTVMLCSCGADSNAADEKGDTALAMLVEQDHLDAAWRLSNEFKASINRCSRNRKKAQRAKLLLTLRERQIKSGKIPDPSNVAINMLKDKEEDEKKEDDKKVNDIDMEFGSVSKKKSKKPKSKAEKKKAALNKAKKEKVKKAKAKADRIRQEEKEQIIEEQRRLENEKEITRQKRLLQLQKQEQGKKGNQSKNQSKNQSNMNGTNGKKKKKNKNSGPNTISIISSSTNNNNNNNDIGDQKTNVNNSEVSNEKGLPSFTTSIKKKTSVVPSPVSEEEWAPVMSRADKQKANKKRADAIATQRAKKEEIRQRERAAKLAKERQEMAEKQQQKEVARAKIQAAKIAKEKEETKIQEKIEIERIKQQEKVTAIKTLRQQKKKKDKALKKQLQREKKKEAAETNKLLSNTLTELSVPSTASSSDGNNKKNTLIETIPTSDEQHLSMVSQPKKTSQQKTPRKSSHKKSLEHMSPKDVENQLFSPLRPDPSVYTNHTNITNQTVQQQSQMNPLAPPHRQQTPPAPQAPTTPSTSQTSYEESLMVNLSFLDMGGMEDTSSSVANTDLSEGSSTTTTSATSTTVPTNAWGSTAGTAWGSVTVNGTGAKTSGNWDTKTSSEVKSNSITPPLSKITAAVEAAGSSISSSGIQQQQNVGWGIANGVPSIEGQQQLHQQQQQSITSNGWGTKTTDQVPLQQLEKQETAPNAWSSLPRNNNNTSNNNTSNTTTITTTTNNNNNNNNNNNTTNTTNTTRSTTNNNTATPTIIERDEPPPVALMRNEKMRQILDHITRQQDPAYKSVLVTVLLRWIERAAIRNDQRRRQETEIPWKTLVPYPDPLLPSHEFGNFSGLIGLHADAAARMFLGINNQKVQGRQMWSKLNTFLQMCTAMANDISNGRDWHAAQYNENQGVEWNDAMYGFNVSPSSTSQLSYMPESLVLPEIVIAWSTGASCTMYQKTYDELSRLYMCNNRTGRNSPTQLLGRIYNMVQRYDTVNYVRTQHQPVLPHSLFQTLAREFGAHHECFATPLNRHYDSYCSPFPDTDVSFGSFGSFYDYYPSTGSFLCHPPPVQQDILQMYAHINQLLLSDQPISFFVFTPMIDTIDPVRDVHLGEYVTHSAVVQRGCHVLTLGNTFRTSSATAQMPLNETVYLSSNDSAVVFLQNAAGRLKWPVTEKKIQIVLSSLMPDNGLR